MFSICQSTPHESWRGMGKGGGGWSQGIGDRRAMGEEERNGPLRIVLFKFKTFGND